MQNVESNACSYSFLCSSHLLPSYSSGTGMTLLSNHAAVLRFSNTNVKLGCNSKTWSCRTATWQEIWLCNVCLQRVLWTLEIDLTWHFHITAVQLGLDPGPMFGMYHVTHLAEKGNPWNWRPIFWNCFVWSSNTYTLCILASKHVSSTLLRPMSGVQDNC